MLNVPIVLIQPIRLLPLNWLNVPIPPGDKAPSGMNRFVWTVTKQEMYTSQGGLMTWWLLDKFFEIHARF